MKDRCKGVPASIKDKVMQPFMTVLKDNPERVTFLRDPFEKFAKDHVKLRVLTGIFAGCEGYIVRIDRDRQLVFDFGVMLLPSVASIKRTSRSSRSKNVPIRYRTFACGLSQLVSNI